MDRGLQRKTVSAIEIPSGLVRWSTRGFQDQQVAIPFLNFFFNPADQRPTHALVLIFGINCNPIDIKGPCCECMRTKTGKTFYNVIFLRNQERIVAGFAFGEEIFPQFGDGIKFDFAENFCPLGYFLNRWSVVFLCDIDGKHLTASKNY